MTGDDDLRGSGTLAGLRRARKILVIGCGGSGKSTLARRLGDILGIEVVHLDRLYWKPGWVEPRPREWEQTVRRLVEKRAWILDGNYGGTLDLRLAAAAAVIFLDLPRSHCLRRVISRRLKYSGRTRPDMTPGCPERVTLQFLRYIWRYPTERRPAILRRLEERSPGMHTLVLRSPGEIRRFLAALDTQAAEKR